jgi:transposase
LHFLPPYCSDANLVERQRLDLYANATRNPLHRSMIQLMIAIRRYLHRRFYAFRGVCCGC